MPATDFEAIKRATARLVCGGASGTGYLVAPLRIATCAHVVRDWPEGKGTAFLGPDQVELAAKVLATDETADCALVEVSQDLQVAPLPLGSVPTRKSPWDGFGFPALAKGTGLPIDGHVSDPKSTDDRGVASILLYSPEVAAGQASPIHGFSGSPVVIQGAVVGHLRKYLGDPDDRKRAAYGYIYATPILAVRALLGDQAGVEVRQLAPERIESLAEHIPSLEGGQSHVFVSYRSVDQRFAKNLTRRLEGAGLLVYMAENELRPGDSIVASLDQALARSRAAITIVSRAWLESPWCKAEMDHLVQRALQDSSFRLIPVRIDPEAELPSLLSNREFLDVTPAALEDETQNAELIDDLLWGLVGKPKPSRDSAAQRVGGQELAAVGRFSLELKLAADRDPASVLSVWKDWQKSGLGDVSPALQAAEILIAQARPDLALKVLDALGKTGLRAQQLRGLALCKSEGRRDEGIYIFESLRRAGHRDPETTGNLAAAYKARFRNTHSTADLDRAYTLYAESYQVNADPWTGINAADLAFRVGEEDKSRDLADELARNLEKKPEDGRSHWDWATLGQAYLLARRKPKAMASYRTANAKAGRLVRDIAVMREGARDNLVMLGDKRDEFDALFSVPNVVAFVGHVTDLEGRAPSRFPMSKIPAVRKEIRRRLESLRPVHGYSGIARGSDIIFIEELLALEGTCYVVMPIPPADFRRVSVGGPWNQRFDALLTKVEIEQLNSECPPDAELPDLFDRANLKVQRHAIEYAEKLFQKPKVIAVWDGKPGDGKGGTADAVARWQMDGYDVDIIDITKL
jgi:tetratricopeptide (TPR) repeat protein